MTEQNKDQKASQDLDDKQLDQAVGGAVSGGDARKQEHNEKVAAESSRKSE